MLFSIYCPTNKAGDYNNAYKKLFIVEYKFII